MNDQSYMNGLPITYNSNSRKNNVSWTFASSFSERYTYV